MKILIAAIALLINHQLCMAELQPINEENLKNITGQAGLTIAFTSHLKIDSLQYKDEGSFIVNDITIAGANKSTYFGKDWGNSSHSGNNLDGALMTVDILSDGDLVLSAFIDPALGGGVIDFKLSTGAIQLQNAAGTQTSTLIDSINMTGLGVKFRAKVDNQTRHILMETEVGIDDMDIELSTFNLAVENLIIAGPTYFESLDEWGASALALSDTTALMAFDVHANSSGLVVDITQMQLDIGIGAIRIGDDSIGSFRLQGINMNSTSMTLSGHP